MAKKKTQAEKTHEEAARQATKPPRRPSVDEQVKMLTSLPEEDVEQMMKEHEANRESPDTPIRQQREEEPDIPRGPLDLPRGSPQERDIPDPPKGSTDSQHFTDEPRREQAQEAPFFGAESSETRMSESFSEAGLTVREADLSNLFDDGDDVREILTDIRELLRDIPMRIAEELRNG